MRFIILLIITILLDTPAGAQKTIGAIPLPGPAYKRAAVPPESFGSWLRNLPLKPAGSPVYDYRGRVYKTGGDTTIAAVVDMEVQGRRLEQCMDILIRLYAEYLWSQGRAGELRLPLPGGYQLAWDEWWRGFRPRFRGIEVALVKAAQPDSSEKQFEAYLRTVYAESHTQQFYHTYTPVAAADIRIGDFFVLRGSKSHAVMVVDLAVGPDGTTYALIGHGDTPACQLHLLNYRHGQPWIPLDPEKPLPLPIRRKMTWDGVRRFAKPAEDQSGPSLPE
jgi:hypothetical protein